MATASKTLRIAAISGSLRKASTNTGALRYLASIAERHNVIVDIVDFADVPIYNQDTESDPPASVVRVKEAIKGADAVVFATPEFNYSIPGPLKNVIDWASRKPNVFAEKPAGVIGAGGGMGTSRAQYHLRQVCVFLRLDVMTMPETFVRIFSADAVDWATGDIKDTESLAKLDAWMEAFVTFARRNIAGREAVPAPSA